TSRDAAAVAALNKAISQDPRLGGGVAQLPQNCYTNHKSDFPNYPYLMQDMPTCVVTTADSACVSCAKNSCCMEFQACFIETNCRCLVMCLGGGGTVADCTSASKCGPASSASVAMAACLSSSCPVECPDVSGMMSAMPSGGMCSSSPTSSSTSSSG